MDKDKGLYSQRLINWYMKKTDDFYTDISNDNRSNYEKIIHTELRLILAKH